MTDKLTYEELVQRVKEFEKEAVERKRVEKLLIENEAKFGLIADSSAEVIWQLDLNGQVIYASPAVQKIFGYTPQEAMHLGFSSLFPASEIERATQAFSRAVSGEEHQLLEFTGQRKDGSSIAIEISITPIIQDNAIAGVQGIVRDITDRKQAEEALRENEEKYRDLYDNAPDMFVSVELKTANTMMADSTQISQVLMNLCTNAKNAMQEDGGVLEVNLENITLDETSATLYESLSPGNYLKLIVKDNGHGIDSKIIDRIFDPYFTTTSQAEGTGMGLAVVHGIVKNHNGAITVASEPGRDCLRCIISSN